MRIAVISIGSFDTQYSDYHIMKDILVELLQRGHRVLLYQKQYLDKPNYPVAFEKYLKKGQLVVYNFPFVRAEKSDLKARYLADIKYYGAVCRKVYSQKPDTIFLQSNNTAFVTLWYARNVLKVPVVYNEQDIFPENARLAGILSEKSAVYRIAKVLQNYAYRRASLLCTISEDMKHTICKEYSIPEKCVTVIYNWGHEDLAASNESENYYFRQCNCEDDVFRVMYAGNLGKMQNVEFVLQAAARLKRDRTIKFYIVGNGANEKALKEFAEKEQLSNVVFWDMQPPEKVADLYAFADVNLIPLREKLIYAALPSKTADCLLSGKNILACIDQDSDFSQLLDQYGICNVGVESPEELCKAIRTLQSSPMKNRDRKLLEDYFDKTKNVAAYCDLIEKSVELRRSDKV